MVSELTSSFSLKSSFEFLLALCFVGKIIIGHRQFYQFRRIWPVLHIPLLHIEHRTLIHTEHCLRARAAHLFCQQLHSSLHSINTSRYFFFFFAASLASPFFSPPPLSPSPWLPLLELALSHVPLSLLLVFFPS